MNCSICGAMIWQQVIDYRTVISVNELTLVETRIPNPRGPTTTSTCAEGHVMVEEPDTGFGYMGSPIRTGGR